MPLDDVYNPWETDVDLENKPCIHCEVWPPIPCPACEPELFEQWHYHNRNKKIIVQPLNERSKENERRIDDYDDIPY